jgi:hypothetical protein
MRYSTFHVSSPLYVPSLWPRQVPCQPEVVLGVKKGVVAGASHVCDKRAGAVTAT